MSKDKSVFDLEERFIDFAVRIIRAAESFFDFGNKHKTRETKGKYENFIIRNSLFDIRYSLHS